MEYEINKSGNIGCMLDDSGIFVGLISLPLQHEIDLYKNEIVEGIFKKYKKAVKENFSHKTSSPYFTEFEDSFYIPKAYYLFGRFDMAILSLIDDFEFACRTFHPFDPMTNAKLKHKPYLENFIHKVITGPTPKFKEDDNIISLAKNTFLTDNSKPLFGICTLKLNNALLIGNGTDFFRFVIKFIKHIYDSSPTIKNKTDIIILESYSWHEITILLFSNSYENMYQFVLNLRESSFGDLVKYGEASEFNFENSSLIMDLFSKKRGKYKKYDINETHLFADSEIYLGFDFRIFNELLNESEKPVAFDRIDPKDKINLFTQWFVRPGHLKEAIEILELNGISKRGYSFGKSELLFQIFATKQNEEQPLKTREVISNFLALFKYEELQKHVTQTLSIPQINKDLPPVKKVGGGHFYFLQLSKSLQFNVDDITNIERMLRELAIPKILTAKILNIYSNFNDGILDQNLFGYFCELRPFMESVIDTIEVYCKIYKSTYNITILINKLQKFSDNFERAYRNRFHNSYRMGDITDFNIEYKGGIQQLVTSFDSTYKAVSSVLGNPDSFAYVSGNPGVYSTEYEIRLNYFHN